MNGIESLIHTLVAGGVDTCFANPGTSEMLFVAAVDDVPELKCVLCLSEAVVTGAADGYGRMTDKPAATLLHTGVGLANGLSGLHVARKAHTPMINLVGQNGARHQRYESILDANIEAPLSTYSDWMRVNRHSLDMANDTAEAIYEAQRAPGRIASMVVQTDAAAGESEGPARIKAPAQAPHATPATIQYAARLLRDSRKTVIIIDGKALRERGLLAASRIAAKTGATVYTPGTWARLQRGAGLPGFPEFPFPVAQGQKLLEGVDSLILVGARLPVGSFSYPGLPSSPVSDAVEVCELARPEEDLLLALEALVAELGATDTAAQLNSARLPEMPTGSTALSAPAIAAAIANLLPSRSIIVEECSTAADLRPMTVGAAAHDYLKNTGGAIGAAIPLALGAAVAFPDRPVLCVQGDGGAMYSPQALWSLARQKANVTVVIYANREYRILLNELTRMGVQAPKGNARELLEIGNPDIDWVSLARGMGLSGCRATTNDEFVAALQRAFTEPGPTLIEAVL